MKKLATIVVATLALGAPLTAIGATPAAADPGSPTCVTKTEFSKVKVGMTMAKVKRIFGTDAFGGGPGQSTFQGCPKNSMVSIYYKRSDGAQRVTKKTATW